ncbi:MAG: DUF4160 domain-containing protein [Terrimicrobiaceae bacterium]|nr:DUF4160 domain-containing protein [Terrimicrobiaceae bacterium]
MPEISRFYGIIIQIYFADHPPPHFHALYGDSTAVIDINHLSVLRGNLPPRALGLVIEWASIHQTELLKAFSQAQNMEMPTKILPLS